MKTLIQTTAISLFLVGAAAANESENELKDPAAERIAEIAGAEEVVSAVQVQIGIPVPIIRRKSTNWMGNGLRFLQAVAAA